MRGSGIVSNKNKFEAGDRVNITSTGEEVTIKKWHYVVNMKKVSYVVNEHPSTFYFEDELKKA